MSVSSFTAHHLRDLPGNRQAQAGAAVFAGGRAIHLGDWDEELVNFIGGYTDARIADFKAQ